MLRFLLVTCFLTCSCAPVSSPRVETFGYVLRETTGITTSVIQGEKEMAILFTPNSDPIALRTLRSLDWRTLYPNANGHHIFVKGSLDNNVHWTPNEPNMAQSEPYRQFRLVNWYIVTPYERLVLVNESLPLKLKKEVRQSLKTDDFEGRDVVDGVDLARFQKKQKP